MIFDRFISNVSSKSMMSVLFLFFTLSAAAQNYNMKVTLKDGNIITLPTASIESIIFEQNVPEQLQGLTGRWQLIASNNGVEVAPGVYSAGIDTIAFTATPSTDGTYLECYADRFYTRTGNVYSAHWRMLVETNDQQQRRIGWLLDTESPASSQEFQEPRENYLEKGFFYWGSKDASATHRYIYLLSENENASAIIGMTLWSPWGAKDATSYSLSNEEHNSQKVYAVVATQIPYGDSVGWIEIWGSPRFEKVD